MKWSFLIFLISTPSSTPSLSSPLMSTVWNRQERDMQPVGRMSDSPAWGWKYRNWLQTRCNIIMGPQAWKNLFQSISCPRAVSEKFVILGKRLCSWLLIIAALVSCRIFVCIEESSYFFQTSSFLQLCWILDSSSSLLPFILSKVTSEFTCACILCSYIGQFERCCIFSFVLSQLYLHLVCFLKSERFSWV